MAVMNRRSRIISLRLSQEEYDLLRDLSISQGARSISEFTRSVACQLPKNGNGNNPPELTPVEAALGALNDTMSTLNQNIQRLTDILETRKNEENE
ncbi:MAG: hypothetical protein JXR49_16495 [Acidobacteria bacterium]|nr:hypothetical protein [Acidobacteriota bacterium]